MNPHKSQIEIWRPAREQEGGGWEFRLLKRDEFASISYINILEQGIRNLQTIPMYTRMGGEECMIPRTGRRLRPPGADAYHVNAEAVCVAQPAVIREPTERDGKGRR